MARVRVRWFAALRERRGVAAETLDVADGATLASIYEALIPADGRLTVGFARNLDHVPGDTVVADGDEIVFLPPLGGG